MQELICFSAFLYQYIEFFVFLKVARRGWAIAPLAPPKSATEAGIINMNERILYLQYNLYHL